MRILFFTLAIGSLTWLVTPSLARRLPSPSGEMDAAMESDPYYARLPPPDPPAAAPQPQPSPTGPAPANVSPPQSSRRPSVEPSLAPSMAPMTPPVVPPDVATDATRLPIANEESIPSSLFDDVPDLAPTPVPIAPPAHTGSVFANSSYGVSNYSSSGYGGEGYGTSGYGASGYGDGGRCLPAICDECPKRGWVASVAYDSWRGVADGNWQNNGIRTGLNFGTRLGKFSEWTGFGGQVGGSVIAANWAGTDYRAQRLTDSEVQGFFTYGLFRRANENSQWSAAIAQDWMYNDNFGVYGVNPVIGQYRWQAAWATSAVNEFGLWGTFRANDDTVNTLGGPGTFRAVQQVSSFWHYKWGLGGADTTIWVGLPEHDRLLGGGSLGDYYVGAVGNVPVSDRWAMNAMVTYMHQSASPGGPGAEEDAWNFSIEMSYYPARNARTCTVAGQCWMPLLPVANNGLFLVDTNRYF